MRKIPNNCGISLRYQHLTQIINTKPKIAWLEVHSENFFDDNKQTYQLEQIAQHYPLSMHCIGLSIGSSDKLNKNHLHKLKIAVDRFKPNFISDHLSWNSVNNTYLNDLLPIPYTKKVYLYLLIK